MFSENQIYQIVNQTQTPSVGPPRFSLQNIAGKAVNVAKPVSL